MSSIIFFLIFIPILSVILLSVNFIFAPHNPYKEKKTPFECGYHSFLSQNRTQFTISFFIFALLFLIFDLEIVLIYPYTVSSYANNVYGLIVMIVFTLIVTVGFIFELGKNALKIESKQTQYLEPKSNAKVNTLKPLQSSLILPKFIMNYIIKNKYTILFTVFTAVFLYIAKIPVRQGFYIGILLIAFYSLLFKKVKLHFKKGSYCFSKWDFIMYSVIVILLSLVTYLGYLLHSAYGDFIAAITFVLTMHDKLTIGGTESAGTYLESLKSSKVSSLMMEQEQSSGSKGKGKRPLSINAEDRSSNKTPSFSSGANQTASPETRNFLGTSVERRDRQLRTRISIQDLVRAESPKFESASRTINPGTNISTTEGTKVNPDTNSGIGATQKTINLTQTIVETRDKQLVTKLSIQDLIRDKSPKFESAAKTINPGANTGTTEGTKVNPDTSTRIGVDKSINVPATTNQNFSMNPVVSKEDALLQKIITNLKGQTNPGTKIGSIIRTPEEREAVIKLLKANPESHYGEKLDIWLKEGKPIQQYFYFISHSQKFVQFMESELDLKINPIPSANPVLSKEKTNLPEIIKKLKRGIGADSYNSLRSAISDLDDREAVIKILEANPESSEGKKWKEMRDRGRTLHYYFNNLSIPAPEDLIQLLEAHSKDISLKDKMSSSVVSSFAAGAKSTDVASQVPILKLDAVTRAWSYVQLKERELIILMNWMIKMKNEGRIDKKCWDEKIERCNDYMDSIEKYEKVISDSGRSVVMSAKNHKKETIAHLKQQIIDLDSSVSPD